MTRIDIPGCTVVTGIRPCFLDINPPHFSNIARIGNQGSIRAYLSFGGVPVTGLNRGFLESCFRITDYPALNTERRVVRG